MNQYRKNTNDTLARWHERLQNPDFNISKFLGKTLAGVMNFLYFCSVK